ncbi:MAG TPA: extracellular solute-binding protein [Pirellulales bacterium]|nr:extracellular solute-binding protein [Pirellulales bacterium]
MSSLSSPQSAFRRAKSWRPAWLLAVVASAAGCTSAGCTSAGCTSANDSASPEASTGEAASLSGVELKLVVVDDPGLAEAVRLLRGEWQGSTGAKLEIVEQTSGELLGAAELTADALIYPAECLGELAERNWLAPIPKATLDDPQLAWPEIFEADKSRLATWGTEAYAIPFGSPVLTCCYRADLLKKLDRKPPETWAEYQALAEFLADRSNLGDAAPADGEPWFAAAEPLAEGWAGLTLLARAAPYAKHRNHYSTLFDMESMEPLIAKPPFVKALDELLAAAKFGATSKLDFGPEQARQALARGQCALALTWPAPARSQELAQNGKSAGGVEAPLDLGFVELPGAGEVYNLGSQAWDKRRPEDNPHVPLLGVSGRLGSISRNSTKSEAAGHLLAWLSGPQWGQRVATASKATTLFRESQLAAPAEWLDLNVEEPAALQYAEAVQRSISQEESLTVLRIPARQRYMAALDQAVRQAVSGELESQAALDQAAETWRTITAELGLEAQRQAYHRDLGLR